MKSIFTYKTSIVLPLQTIAKNACSINELIIIIAFITISTWIFTASINYTNSSNKSIMLEALYTNSSRILQASILHFQAWSTFWEIEPTLTGNASKIIVFFTLRDEAFLIDEFERFETFQTRASLRFYLASKKIIMPAFIKYERELGFTTLTTTITKVSLTIFYTSFTDAFLSNIAISAIITHSIWWNL